jgi:hypothetical protein
MGSVYLVHWTASSFWVRTLRKPPRTSVALQVVGAMPMAQQLQLSKQLGTEQSVRSIRTLIVVTSGGKS